MVQLVRYLLFPFSVLYGIVVGVRHWLYDRSIFKSVNPCLPTICVGNISLGGTGKTPMVEYLIRKLLPYRKVGVVSRGYKRQSKGFLLANQQSSVTDLGDEPFQFWKKYPSILLAVDANRVRAIKNLSRLPHPPEVILLDDAFQHRKVKALKNIVLTDYNHLFTNDWLLPTGNLRDVKSRVKHADAIVVTKCPDNISDNQRLIIKEKVKRKPLQNVFFTTISYSKKVYSETEMIDFQYFIKKHFTLVTGIANPQPLLCFLNKHKANYKHISFADHHQFSPKEIEQLRAENRILTTEKDYVRMQNHIKNVFYLPIEMTFIDKSDEKQFLEIITNLSPHSED